MPCICQYFMRNKRRSSSERRRLSPRQTPDTASSLEPSRSTTDVAALRADIWSLNLNLSETQVCCDNLETNLANTVHEKYELIDDLNKYKQAHGDLETRMAVERDEHAAERADLLNEIYFLKGQLRERSELFDQVAVQNVSLKRRLCETNETILQMGLMFLKMKFTKGHAAAAVELAETTDDSDRQ